jgi:hypothetical protein
LILLAAAPWQAFAEVPRTLPAEVYTKLKSGHKLDKVWMDPSYDASTGFTIGKVTTMAEGDLANSIDYFPYALNRLTIPGSVNTLDLTVTELIGTILYSKNVATAAMTVEGRILDRDGKTMFAFSDREECSDGETPLKNCQQVMDRITWKLAKELGKPLEEALAVKMGVDKNPSASGLVPAPPKNQSQAMSPGERLLQLDNLHKNGLINDEEYASKKAEIVKGL